MDTHLGIDIGGSGIKGAPIDVLSDALTADRRRIATPQPALAEPVSRTPRKIVGSFPGVTGRSGVVLVLTLGTGIGSALPNDGLLVPDTELGRLELGGEVVEKRASNRARKTQGSRSVSGRSGSTSTRRTWIGSSLPIW